MSRFTHTFAKAGYLFLVAASFTAGLANSQTASNALQLSPSSGLSVPAPTTTSNPNQLSNIATDTATPNAPAPLRGAGQRATPVSDTLAITNSPSEEPESEFQKFVQSASGKKLPIFGAELFLNRGFNPGELAPVANDYTLGAGDEVLVRAWGSLDIDFKATVDRDGLLNIPRVGSFRVAGLRPNELESRVRSEMAKTYRNFNVSVTLGKLNGVAVFVVGQVKRPGSYIVPGQPTMLSALFAAGGPNVNGSMRKIQLRRQGTTVGEIDLYDLIVVGDKSKDLRLVAGDVVFVPPAGPRVALLGTAKVPAIYEVLPNTRLATLLEYAGGAPVLANPAKVLVEQIDPTQKVARRVDEVALNDVGLNRKLQDGDVLTLLAISPRFENAVTLRGNVERPLRHAFKPGMRIKDLIPAREALITPDYYTRKNILVQYESGKNADADKVERDVRNMLDEVNWDYAVIERLNQRDLNTQLLPFNLARAILDEDPLHNLPLQAGDVVTIFSKKDVRVPVSRQTQFVRLEGEVRTPGIYQLQPGETLQKLLQRAGGLTEQAYLYGLTFTRESTRKLQQDNLDRALQRAEQQANSQLATTLANQTSAADANNAARMQQAAVAAQQAQLARLRTLKPTGRIALELGGDVKQVQDVPDIVLEDADKIFIPSKPSFISVVGAVNTSSAFVWKAKRTVQQYLDIAGVDREADLNGVFVVRADGSIMAPTQSWFSASVQSQALLPGDTIVVPEKLNRESAYTAFMRGLKDWSQVLGQFGIAAAAIHTLSK
ncbi:polysaccharide biosynthesis/export family protein [Parvibium lacunae]|uniref:Sugar transporter n=1 Tax=Parvibium lacunae TaxID=1888893 RepID=A0A368L224_9BURK|nr:SLBB domain-containing protein [Parvibium lacunae]RCS57440.1 sugar transporter [Parvibium lacunae]